MPKHITETLTTPIIHESDVVVVGGGPAGVSAALSARRHGASVVLIERFGHLGGQATGGLVIEFFGAADGAIYQPGRVIKGGIYQQIIEQLKAYDAVTRAPDVLVQPEYLKLVCQQMLVDAGVTVIPHSLCVGARVENDAVRAVIVESKSGREAIAAGVFVDCTGDGDLAPWCDVPFELLFARNLKHVTLVYRFGNVDIQKADQFRSTDQAQFSKMQQKAHAALGFRLTWNRTMNTNEVWTDEAHIHAIDCTNVADLTKAEFQGRVSAEAALRFYRENVPGFEHAEWIDTAPQIGVRESRRICGLHTLTLDECKTQTLFNDTVVLNPYRSGGPGKIFGIPLRCLQPKSGPKNLLFAGRCISVAHDAIDLVREIPSCVCMGEAAGIAAALALKDTCDTRAVDPQEVRNTLIESGAIIE